MFSEQDTWEVHIESSFLAVSHCLLSRKKLSWTKKGEQPLKEPSFNADKGTDLDTDGKDDHDHSDCSARDTSYHNFADSKN